MHDTTIKLANCITWRNDMDIIRQAKTEYGGLSLIEGIHPRVTNLEWDPEENSELVDIEGLLTSAELRVIADYMDTKNARHDD